MSESNGDPMDGFASVALTPEEQGSNSEIRNLLEEAAEKLPDAYRTVFMLRTPQDAAGIAFAAAASVARACCSA